MLLISNLLWAQDSAQWEQAAAVSYESKSYGQAGQLYRRAADEAWIKSLRKKSYYNAACSFALDGQPDRAFENLDLLIKNGYSNRVQLQTDADLASLRTDARWAKAIASIKSRSAESPHQSKYITSDIDLFYHAFDLAIKDTAKAAQIFKDEYFSKGSDGLQDFFVAKIGNVERFTKTVLKNRDFYANARKTIQQTTALKGPIRKYTATLEDLYPQAVFPDVYFLVGQLNSNGTISDNGLLIGTEQMSKTPTTPTTGWTNWQREWIMNFDQIPVTVIHELVHFNQDGMTRENTLLCYAMFEGSAEFITELVTGQTDGDYGTFQPDKLRIWNDFTASRHEDLYTEWIEAQPGKRPRNALYWAGYMISKAYYAKAANKSQALHDLMHIKDYETFYLQSDVENYLENN